MNAINNNLQNILNNKFKILINLIERIFLLKNNLVSNFKIFNLTLKNFIKKKDLQYCRSLSVCKIF